MDQKSNFCFIQSNGSKRVQTNPVKLFFFVCSYWPGSRVKKVNMNKINVLAAHYFFCWKSTPTCKQLFCFIALLRFSLLFWMEATRATTMRSPSAAGILLESMHSGTSVCGDGGKIIAPSSSRGRILSET